MRTFFALFLGNCLLANLAHAGELDRYLDLLDNHPKVLAVIAEARALRHQAEGAMGLPDPAVSLGLDNVPVSDPAFDRFLPTSKVIGFSQEIPNRAGRRAQREIFRTTAATTELLADYTRSRLQALFFSRLAELQRVIQQSAHEEKKKQIIAQLQNYYEGQLVAGEAVYEKTFLTEIELAEVEQKQNTLRAEREGIEADLLQLVGEVPDPSGLPSRKKKWNGELSGLYPVRLASGGIEVEQARVDFAGSAFLPRFGIAGAYKFREDGADDAFAGDDWFSLQVKFSLPLWSADNQSPKRAAALSRKKNALYRYREALRTWRVETTRLVSGQHAATLNLQVLHKKDESLRSKIAAMERNYSAAQGSLEPVLQAELARLSLLSQIAGERARHAGLVENLNAHVISEP